MSFWSMTATLRSLAGRRRYRDIRRDHCFIQHIPMLLAMVLVQGGTCALLGTGLGLGLCALVGQFASEVEYPFRMMWFTPLVGSAIVLLVSLVAAIISVRPVLKLDPGVVFVGR